MGAAADDAGFPVSLDGLPPVHLRVLLDGLPVFERYGLHIIDLHAVASAFSYVDLENLARRHDPGLDLEAILDHLAGVSVFPDDDFTEYGLGESRIADLRRWVTGWYDDLARRLAAERTDDELPDDL